MNEVILDINGTSHRFAQAPSVEELLSHLSISNQNGLALAVNQSVLPKANWLKHHFENQDQILIISATQGG